MSVFDVVELAEYNSKQCKHSTRDGYCTLFECPCRYVGYCGVGSE